MKVKIVQIAVGNVDGEPVLFGLSEVGNVFIEVYRGDKYYWQEHIPQSREVLKNDKSKSSS